MKTLDRIAWIDTETTGVGPKFSGAESHLLLEIACVVTDLNLNRIDSDFYHAYTVPTTPFDQVITNASPWAVEHHSASGLFTHCELEGKQYGVVDDELLGFLTDYAAPQQMMIGGASVRFDREYLEEYLPRSAAYLHYHMVDASSILNTVGVWAKYQRPAGPPAHTAEADILGTIDQLRELKALLRI